MKDDPYRAQKKTKKGNQNLILKMLYNKPMRFKQLKEQTNLSAPILSKHLKSLQNQKKIIKDIIKGKPVYKLTPSAFSHPFLHTLVFQDGAISRITREISNKREDYSSISTTVLPEEKGVKHTFLSLELSPKTISKTPEIEILQAIDRWITPILLYSIIQELKKGEDWTKAFNDVIQYLIDVIKQKDLDKFEEGLREKYSKTLVQKYFFIHPQEKIPIIDSLDGIIEHIKAHEFIDSWEEEGGRKRLPPFEKVGTNRKGIEP